MAVPVQGQVQPQDLTELVTGDDACALLADDEILRATEGNSILSRTPGPQSFLPAGCQYDVEIEDAFGPLQILLGVASPGGRQQYDTFVPFDDIGQPLSGIGDEAADLGFGSVMAVEGDTAVSIEVVGFGGGRPSSLAGRALIWAAMSRIVSEPPLLATAALAGPGVLPTDQPSLDAVAAIRTSEFGDDSVQATVELLAEAGIEVIDPMTGSPMSPVGGTASPLKVMDFQARALAAEAWADGGLSGADLDQVLGAPADGPLTSSILAGWLAAVDTPNARMARAVMAGQDVSDPTALRFPMLALLLFSADIVTDAQAAAPDPAPTPLAMGGGAFLSAAVDASSLGEARTAQASPCSVGQTFVDDIIATVFEALGEPVPGDVEGSVVDGIWDWLSAQGESFTRAAAAELTEDVITDIRDAAGLIAVIGQVGSVAMPMFVTVTPTPGSLVLPVEPASPIDGHFTATVFTVSQDWPLIVNECALAAGITLPALTTTGRAVDWGSIEYATPPARQPLFTEGTADQALDMNVPSSARQRFRSAVETPELAKGPEQLVVVKTDATVARGDLTEGLEAVVETLFERIPSIIRPEVQEELGPEVDELLEGLMSVVDARGIGTMTIVYHTPPVPTPLPDEEPDEARAVWVRYDREAIGSAVQAARVLELYSCSGPYGPWSGVLRAGGVGPVQLTDLPVKLTFPGSSGVQTATTSTDGVLHWDLPGISSAVHFDIQATVDGSSMVLAISGTANEQVQGQELLGGISVSGVPQALPIEPAPEGSCPAE
jgi:hypothetical protein